MSVPVGDSNTMRVTATARFRGGRGVVGTRRQLVQEAMERLRQVLDLHGIEFEYVVGQVRSPEMLRASLDGLAGGDEELLDG